MKTIELVAGMFDIRVADSPQRIPRGSRHDLPKLFAAAGFTRGAEIGVWKGGYAEILCRVVPNLRLWCVDPYESYPEYDEQKNKPSKIDEACRLAHTKLAPYNCKYLRMRSVEAATHVADRSLDFVYIDGNHAEAYVRADLEAWAPKVKPGGILAGHDYNQDPEKPFIQVKPAVDAYIAAHQIKPWFILAGDKTPSFFWVVS